MLMGVSYRNRTCGSFKCFGSCSGHKNGSHQSVGPRADGRRLQPFYPYETKSSLSELLNDRLRVGNRSANSEVSKSGARYDLVLDVIGELQ